MRFRNRRFRIEHAQHLRSDDIARFGRLSVIPSIQPYHDIDDGRWAATRIGPVRIRTTYAFRSLLDAEAALAFGSDWPVAPSRVVRADVVVSGKGQVCHGMSIVRSPVKGSVQRGYQSLAMLFETEVYSGEGVAGEG